MAGKRIDLTKHTFGSLRVIDFAGVYSGAAYWRCECRCGQARCRKSVKVKATRLLRGLTDDCGALGYRQDSARHKTARALVKPRKRREIAELAAMARWGNAA